MKWLEEHEKAAGTFLDCFTAPDETVLNKVGYARACRCLLSETCHTCGNLTSRANPVTFNRTCPSCAKKDESSALILATKVAPNFYLDANDLVGLPVARVGRAGGATSAVYLLSDVVTLAYDKYGGSEEFMAERERRYASKLPSRQQPRRGAVDEGNPYKRAKAVVAGKFEPLSLRCHAMEALPIGVIERGFWDSQASDDDDTDDDDGWMSRQVTKCSHCAVEGSPDSIASHEWFAHGQTIKPMLQEGVIRLSNLTERDFTHQYVHLLEEAGELRQLVDSVKANYSYVKDKQWYDEEYGQKNLTLWKVKYDFGQYGVQIGITVRNYQVDLVSPGVQSMYFLGVDAQLGGEDKPIIPLAELFQDTFEDDIGCEREADEHIFDKVLSALGLRETSFTQLLMSLIVRVSTNTSVSWRGSATLINDISEIYSESMKDDMPVMEATRLGLLRVLYPQARRSGNY